MLPPSVDSRHADVADQEKMVHQTGRMHCIQFTTYRTQQLVENSFPDKRGGFESLVIPLGLTNAPELFQIFINHTPTAFLNRYIMTYFDDILVNSDTLNEHRVHLRSV